MIIKFALSECIPLVTSENSTGQLIRIASSKTGHIVIEAGTEKARILEAEIKKHPTALFFRAKAIEANKHNTNGDYFSEEELLRSYKSFEGVPFFTNHENQDIEKAKGKIIFAEWNGEEKAVYTTQFVDREAYPHICRSIEEGYASGVSMGCSVEYSVCNLCQNRAEKTEDYCFISDTPILMSDLSVKNISDIVVGDSVIDGFGSITKVTNTFKHNVKDNLQVITSRNICDELVSTSNHPFLVERRGKYTYCEASLLLDKEILFTPIPKIVETEDLFIELSKDGFVDTEENRLLICKLLGYYIAEGSLIHNSSQEDIGFAISLHSDEVDFRNEIVSICNIIFKKSPEIVDRNNYNHKCVDIRLYHPLAVKLVKLSCLGLAKSKTLTNNTISLNEKYLKPILSGYIDGDGHSDKYGRLVITTASKNLAYQVMHLFSLIGVSATIGRYDQNSGPTNRDKIIDIYRVNIAMMQTLKLADYGIKCKKSAEFAKFKEGCQTKLQNTFSNEGFIKHTTYSIEEMPYEGDVYNFETESHSYVANNTSVHNCQHIRNRKGRKFTGSVRNVVTGETKTFKDEPVFEYNYGIKFIELSAVVDPACPSCRIQGIIPSDEYIKKAANVENALRMIKVAALEKEASKEEIDQIDQAIQTLENIAINLIKNRKQVEVSFASDLVEILAKLQEWSDELVGAGYGNLQNEVPGTEGNAPDATGALDATGAPADTTGLGDLGAPAAGAPAVPPPAGAPAPSPVASETPAPVGQVAGKPSASLVKSPNAKPNLPITSPVAPKLSNSENVIVRTSERINKGNTVIASANKLILENNIQNGDEDMVKRRTLSEKNAQNERTKQILSESWQEKQNFFKYIKELPSINEEKYRLAVKKSEDTFVIVAENLVEDEVQVWKYEDLSGDDKDMIINNPKVAASMLLNNFKHKKLEGEKIMSNQVKSAGASSINSNPDSVQEKQLDTKDLYHPRTGDEQEVVTEKQLDGKRTGADAEVVTEKQLGEKIKLHPRTGTEEEVVTQKQLDAVRENDQKEVVTEKQLGEKRTDSTTDDVTEKQLNNVSAPWARAASRDASKYKTASEHMQSVISVMADTAIETGATPQELQKIASTLVDGTKARYELAMAITEKTTKAQTLPYTERLAFWSNKNVKFSSASVADVEQVLIGKLRVVASDLTINPEVIVEAVDVVGEDANALDNISTKIDEKLTTKASVEVKKSVKAELRSALVSTASTKEERDAKRSQILASLTPSQTRESERKEWQTKIAEKLFDPSVTKSSDIVIEATFEEIGTHKKSASFKKDLYSFAKTALKNNDMKLASIVNVTINNDTVQIAVQTENEEGSKESFEFPLGGEGKNPETEQEVPEGDLTGEGLDTAAPTTPPAPAASATPAPTGIPGATASSKKTMKVAQTPAGGGIPGAPAGGAPDQAAGMGAGAAPTGDTPVQSLMGNAPADAGKEGKEGDTEIPTVGEKQMPWTICPECGSSDVEVTQEEDGGIKGTCSACSAEYEAMIKKVVEFKIVKPTVSIGEEGAETPETPEAPEMPALPVAASTKLSKGVLTRIANNQKVHGHVCPSCGMKNCKASVESNGHTECSCGSCKTAFSKDIVIDPKNVKDAHLVVQWDLVPNMECPECVKKAAKFASKVKVGQMLKSASANADKFPMANCVERVTREYGSDTVGSFGPCKGKLVAECVCKQLQKVALTKVRFLDRLAKVTMQVDPLDECIADQTKQGYNHREACSICGVIKKKFATATSENIFVQAFAEDVENKKIKELTLEDLMNLGDMTLQEAADSSVSTGLDEDAELDQDIADAALPEAQEVSVDVEDDGGDVEVECEKCEDGKCSKCNELVEDCKCGKTPKDTSEGTDLREEVQLEDEEGDNMKKEDLLASSSQVKRTDANSLKIAEKLKQVETIAGDVEAGVPRGKATIKNEGKENIDVDMAKPSVPRKDAYMGNEQSSLGGKLNLPDVPSGDAYIGGEREVQKGMPANNSEIKGTVIAESAKTEKTAKKLKEVDTIEKNVDVPRGKATLGNEGKDNVDVTLNDPKVPRGDAYMGNEKDVLGGKPETLDIPTGDAYMGNEKEMQKGMPANNEEYLKQVKQKSQGQLERIATARREAARDTAAWLAANGRIASDRATFDDVVKALSSFEIDKITVAADKMFPEKAKRTASVSTGHAIPAIVMESKSTTGNDLQTKLANTFTVGNSKFDHSLTIYKDDKQD